jgi:hypothetical protein
MLIDHGDAAPVSGLPSGKAATLMHDDADRERVARAALALAAAVPRRP